MSNLVQKTCGAVEVSASVIVVETTDDGFVAYTLMQTLARMGHLPHHWGLATGLTRMRAIEEAPYWKVEVKGSEFQLDPVTFLQTWAADEDTAKASSTMVCGTCCRPWPSKEVGSCRTAGCKGAAMKRSVPIILTGIHHFLEGEKMEPSILELLRVCAQTVQDPNHGRANRRPVIMLIPPGTKLPDSLTRLGIRIEEPLPSRDTIRGEIVPNFVTEAGASPRWKPLIQTLAQDFPAAATDQLAGLSRPEIRTALKMALVTGRDAVVEGQGDFQKAVVDVLGDKKRETLRSAHGLELMDPVDPTSCGGMPLLRSWISGRVNAFSQKARDAKIPQPKSVALLGSPGVGKSLAAKIVGSVLTWPTVKLDIGSMFGSLVGESEGNMRKALQVVEAVAPCVLLLDEVDKAFGGVLSANDSGTSQRLFGTFLTWLQERAGRPEAPVFVIMTMNRVEGLPPELLRKGRVDELFFVDLPNDSEREEILGIHLRRVNGALTNLSAAVAATQMFSGAEIAAVVDEAALTCFQSGTKVNAEAVAKAARETRPLAQTMPEQITSMREFAALRARRSTPLEIPSPSPEIEIDLGSRFGSHGFPSFSPDSTKN